jgi:drug/metabolite transporter (DMT)-like permease
VLSSLTPLATLRLGISFFKVKSTWTKITGVLIGLTGAIWLLLVDKDGGEWTGFQFGLLVVLACLFYGVSTNVIKTQLDGVRSLTISAVSYSMVGVPALAYLFSSGFVEVFEKDEKAWASFGFLCLLAIFGTVIGSLFYFKLIKKTSALFASTVSYLTPVVAILLGSLDGETITPLHFAGMAMILTGVYVARR